MDSEADPFAANAAALKLLSSGMYEPAIRALKQAIVRIRSRIKPSIRNHSVAPSDDVPSLGVHLIPTCDLSASSTRDNCAIFPIYTHAFSFAQPMPVDMAHVNSETQARVAAILMYNTGLAYHQLGLNEQKSDCLLAARKYYRLCVKLIRILLVREPYDFLVCIAAINNLGNVAATRHNAGDAVEAHSSLQEVLEDFNDAMPPSTRHAYQDLVYDFWLTALLFSCDTMLCLAPAA